MRLPKGASFKLISTKNTSFDDLLMELSSQGFDGYFRLSIEGDGGIEDGYVLLKAGDVIGAEYQGKDIIFSEAALEMVKKAWMKEGIIDVYQFSEFQIQLTVEENEEALLSSYAKKADVKAKTTPESEAVIPTPEVVEQPEQAVPKSLDIDLTSEASKNTGLNAQPEIIDVLEEQNQSIAEGILEKRKERLTLLKKFGLKEPQDDFVDTILKNFNLPSERELNSKSRELKKEILNRLKQSTKLEELDLYINSAKMQNTVEFNIDVYVKPLDKKIEEEVKSTIENTLKEKLNFPYEKGLKIIAA
jgi:hypothetical protein